MAMKTILRRNLVFLNLTIILSGCAGVNKLGEVAISEKRTKVRLNVAPRYVNWYLSFPSPKPTAYLEGWIRNNGGASLATTVAIYDDRRELGILRPGVNRLPDKVENITILPGERKRVFRGPLFLLNMFFPDLERERAEIEIELILNKVPDAPYKGDILGSYGGP
jgi:hypothetical protein